MPSKASVRDADLTPGARVLVRVDYNVPIAAGGDRVSDDSRIAESLPTVRHLRARGCRVILCSHRGRPGGVRDESQTLAPAARRLSELLDDDVRFIRDCVGDEAESALAEMRAGDVALLENLRFHAGEEANAPAFASQLARLAEHYVNDGFGAAHRRHASTVGVAEILPSSAGMLMEREIESLRRVTENPPRPYVVAIGGAKVADKAAVIENLSGRVDTFLIGGGMAAAFLRAAGKIPPADGGADGDREVETASRILSRAANGDFEIALPSDAVIAETFAEDAPATTLPVGEIPRGALIIDIGQKTAAEYGAALASARTVVWNGPMGVFEWRRFADGTRAIAERIAALDGAYTVCGGGSTADAVRSLGLANRFSRVSTGGGATLEYLEGKELPGIAALPNARQPL